MPGKVEVPLLVYRWDRAFDLIRQTTKVVIPLRDVTELSAHLGQELAVVADFDFSQPFCFACCEIPNRWIWRPRWLAVSSGHGPWVNALWAARTARSTSSALPRAISAQGSPVYGL